MIIQFFNKNNAMDPTAIGAGVYQFRVGHIKSEDKDYLPLYIGESYSMAVRCSNHLYEVFHRDPAYFGLTYDHLNNKELKLIVEVYETVPVSSELPYSDRDQLLCERELAAIKEKHPLSQLPTSDRLRADRVAVVSEAIHILLEDK